jgi:hypothetical protein
MADFAPPDGPAAFAPIASVLIAAGRIAEAEAERRDHARLTALADLDLAGLGLARPYIAEAVLARHLSRR